jgi:hypothetical protein
VSGYDEEPWTYTFCDLLTDDELAVLPMTGVNFDRGVSQVGALSGHVNTTDPDVRALDPWAATTPRRTALFVERWNPETQRDDLRWAGIVWGRTRSAGSAGLTLVGATFESLLAHWLLHDDLTATQRTAAQAVADVVAAIQARPGAGLGLVVQSDGSPMVRRDRTWRRSDIKTVLQILDSYAETDTPIEYRLDVARAGDRFTKTVLIGEPRLGARYADTGLELAYPDGALLDWKFTEDGTVGDNAGVAVGKVPDGSPSGTVPPSVVIEPSALGTDELAAGFPRLMRGMTFSEETDPANFTALGVGDLLAGLATAEGVWSGMRVRTDQLPLGSWFPGDDAALSVVHPSFREWPAPAGEVVRILAEKVTPGEGGRPDSVELTVASDRGGQLPRSVKFGAQLRRILDRLARLETAPR